MKSFSYFQPAGMLTKQPCCRLHDEHEWNSFCVCASARERPRANALPHQNGHVCSWTCVRAGGRGRARLACSGKICEDSSSVDNKHQFKLQSPRMCTRVLVPHARSGSPYEEDGEITQRRFHARCISTHLLGDLRSSAGSRPACSLQTGGRDAEDRGQEHPHLHV